MAKKNKPRTDLVVDCACVIHGAGYDWVYVEKLYNMLSCRFPNGIRFHVYTEHDRSVPPHMIKHVLEEWPGIGGPKKSWWYKMQLFDSQHHQGNLLYFDLDVVIVNDLQWITELSTDYFWAIRDFRYLQNPHMGTINSSVMWWNVNKFAWIWEDFKKLDITQTVKRWPGDQDYIASVLNVNQRRLFEDRYFESWRWQVADGGYDFHKRQPKALGTGAKIKSETAVVVFHGKPKPHEVKDPQIVAFWK